MEFRVSLLQVGKIYRSSDKVIDHKQEVVDGYPNYYAATHTPGATKATIVKGINTLQPVKMPGKEERIPAIVIVSAARNQGLRRLLGKTTSMKITVTSVIMVTTQTLTRDLKTHRVTIDSSSSSRCINRTTIPSGQKPLQSSSWNVSRPATSNFKDSASSPTPKELCRKCQKAPPLLPIMHLKS